MQLVGRFTREDDSVVEVAISEVADGNFHIDAEPQGLTERRERIMSGPWAVVRQVHGTQVVEADPTLTPEADSLVTAKMGQPIAVQGADCAPLAFVTSRGPIAVAHAGWRGLAGGLVSAVMDDLGKKEAPILCAIVGPVICERCYEFGNDDLDAVASVLGESVRAETTSGRPALDMRRSILNALRASGIEDVRFVSGCTACGGAGFSHRARNDSERHVLVAQILAEAA